MTRPLAALLLALSLSTAAVAATTWGDKDPAFVLSNADLTATQSGAPSAWRSVRATASKISGKWYFELTSTSYDNGNGAIIGFGNISANLASFAGSDSNSVGLQIQRSSYGFASSFGCGWQPINGTVVPIAVDFDTNSVWCYGDFGWNLGFGDPAAGTGASIMPGTVNDGVGVFPMFSGDHNGGDDGMTINTGATPFTYPPPAGFVALDPGSGGGLLLRGVGN